MEIQIGVSRFFHIIKITAARLVCIMSPYLMRSEHTDIIDIIKRMHKVACMAWQAKIVDAFVLACVVGRNPHQTPHLSPMAADTIAQVG